MNDANKILQLTYKTALTNLRYLCRALSDKNNAKIELDPNMIFQEGQTYDAIDGKEPTSKIGIAGLAQTDSIIKSRRTVPDINFITCAISIFHEEHHLSNTITHYNAYKNDEFQYKALLMSHIAKQNNPQYYMQHRTQFPTEIDAEYCGLQKAYQYIQMQFPQKAFDINEIFIRHINHVKNNSTYQLDKNVIPDITSMQELHSVFEKTMNQYATRDDYTYYYGRANNCDELSKILKLPEWDKIATIFCKEKRAWKKDQMVASITLYLHPEYAEKWTELKKFDLSPQHIFHCDFPGDISDRRSKLIQTILPTIPTNNDPNKIF